MNYDEAILDVKVCSFCGLVALVHPESIDQYGEAVCIRCFNQSHSSDPTNDVE